MFLGHLCAAIQLSKFALKMSVLNGCEVAQSLQASTSVDE